MSRQEQAVHPGALATETSFAASVVVLLPLAAGFFFSFRVICLVLAVRVFGSEPQTGVIAILGFNYFLLIGASLQGFASPQIKLTQMLHLPAVRWAALFIAFSGCSLAWTVADSVPAAIAYWAAMAADAIIVVLLIRAGGADEISALLMKGFVWGACAVALAAWIMPTQSDLRLGDEELLGPNQIGYVCAFAFFLAQYLMRANRGRWTPAAILLSLTMLRSLSKTTIVAFIISQVYLLLRDRSIQRKTKVLLALSVAAVLALFWNLFASYLVVYENAGNQAETLTGRIGIWAFLLEAAIQNPWVGHGFHSVWKVVPPFGSFEARHAHNELLQQFYAYGAVGICFMAGIYGSLYLQIRKVQLLGRKAFFLSLLLFVLVRGLTDTEPFDLSLPMWAVILVSILAAQQSAPAVVADVSDHAAIVTPL